MNETIEVGIWKRYMVINVEAVECKGRDNESKEKDTPFVDICKMQGPEHESRQP